MTAPAGPIDVSQAVQQIRAATAARRLSPDGAANIERWLTAEPYADYRPRIVALLLREAYDELDRLFWEVLPFGTGGRRGPMAEMGSATINERTIAESAHGVAMYLKQQKGSTGRTVVVAHDPRRRSPEFARLTAGVLAGHGVKVFLFDGHRATPELSFAVRHLACDAGVMISASHNPPADNGFKAYWSNGGQVLPPHDRGIIDCVLAAAEIPTADFDAAVADGRIQFVGEALDRAYIEAVRTLSLSSARDIRALFTPLHGVGETSIGRVLHEAGFRNVEIFEPQRSPDGDFPNVPDQLPNPERPEVFDPAIAYAKTAGVDLILASDPDADRLGVAVRRPDGEFETLSGNRIGALLTDYVLRKRSAAQSLTPAHYIVETLVTTPLIGRIGHAHGVRVVDDLLVGFKYIGQAIDALGPRQFVFGAEESLGYLAGDYCRDKDAAIAALYVLELTAELAGDGRTLLDRLDELFIEHGYYLEGQRSEVCPGPQGRGQIAAIMQALRAAPPEELGRVSLVRARDYARREIRRLPENATIGSLPEPGGDLLILESADEETQFTIAVRPSGTEPKIKFYFFARTGCASAAVLPAIKRETEAALHEVQNDLSAWIRRIAAN